LLLRNPHLELLELFPSISYAKVIMKYRHIWKKNRKQKLGRFNKQLVIRLVNKGKLLKNNHYHIVLARRRAQKGCRYDKLGFFELGKKHNDHGTL